MTERAGLGWIPDVGDVRDYTLEQADIALFRKRAKIKGPEKSGTFKLPTFVDVSHFCSPIENQGQLGSCTAHAGVGLCEYFQKRTKGKFVNLSRRFLYKLTRKLMRLTGDTGASLRDTMKALVIYGVPPEEWWQYSIADFDKEPDAFLYGLAEQFQAITYYRLDPAKTKPDEVLNQIKSNLASGFPSMYGFSVYQDVFNDAGTTGDIAFPDESDVLVGGHANLWVGFDDIRKITNKRTNQTDVGALKTRNSYGPWGENRSGYGYLSYRYVLERLARDCWTMFDQEWTDFSVFN